jgi:hypothetical protein
MLAFSLLLSLKLSGLKRIPWKIDVLVASKAAMGAQFAGRY